MKHELEDKNETEVDTSQCLLDDFLRWWKHTPMASLEEGCGIAHQVAPEARSAVPTHCGGHRPGPKATKILFHRAMIGGIAVRLARCGRAVSVPESREIEIWSAFGHAASAPESKPRDDTAWLDPCAWQAWSELEGIAECRLAISVAAQLLKVQDEAICSSMGGR